MSVATKHEKAIPLADGMKAVLGKSVNVLYAKGSNLVADAAYEERATMFGKTLNRDNRSKEELLNEALQIASKADVIVAKIR
ncbi:hypothetical protein [Flavobacterium piscinae]|uniref:hypothetical protein n=1 Tax=Flavobacterium piscinae TaxID=2506424 RepID=UPI0037097EF8